MLARLGNNTPVKIFIVVGGEERRSKEGRDVEF